MPVPDPTDAHLRARPRTDAFLRGLGRLLLGAFFRRVDVAGADGFPADGPVIVVANHFNSLIDGALVISQLPRMPRILGASIVWDNKPLVPLLNAAGVVPVFRRQDGRQGQGDLSQTIARTSDVLAAGGVLALFPEGLSHNEPFVLPLKSGAARIALDAETICGPLGVRIVPVGLRFDAKNRFRSRVLVQIGAPLGLGSFPRRYADGDAAARTQAVRDLTARIRQALVAVSPSYPTWEEARLMRLAADIWSRPRSHLPQPGPLADALQRRGDVHAGYRWALVRHPGRATALRSDLSDYDRLLSDSGLTDEQVTAHFPPGFAASALLALLIRLPLAGAGLVLNILPYMLLLALSRRQDLDKRATWSVFAGLFLFPLYWLVQGLAGGVIACDWVGCGQGALVGLGLLVAAPVCGGIALSFLDIYREAVARVRCWIVRRFRRAAWERLVATRQAIHAQLDDLVALYRRTAD